MTSLILIGTGVTIIFISLLADSIGMGDYPGFGWKQMIGTAIGMVDNTQVAIKDRVYGIQVHSFG